MATPTETPAEAKAAPETKPAGIEFYGGYQVYSESGVDLTLLRENLKRTITERMENNRRAAAFIEGIRPPNVAARNDPRPREKRFMFDLEAILKTLVEHQVQFVIVGGQAMVALGSDYITKDLDICYARSRENVTALVEALASLHPYLRGAPTGLPFRLDASTVLAGLNFTLITDAGNLDLLGEVSGIGSYADVLTQSVDVVIYGLAVRSLSLDGLIAAKKAAGRFKDRNHLLELEELKKLRDAGQSRS
jgi:predicted nucleotidyltransferase